MTIICLILYFLGASSTWALNMAVTNSPLKQKIGIVVIWPVVISMAIYFRIKDVIRR